MIDRAISQIAAQLNEYLRGLLGTSEDIVVVSNLLGPDGSPAPNVNNRVILFLTSIEKDTVSQRPPEGRGMAFAGSQPLFLNIYLMVAANFTGANYPESLKFLSLVIGFFHRQPVIDHANSPDLDQRISKLVLDIENTSPQAMSNIWGVLGGRYLPSVLYRVRMVAVGGGDIQGRISPVTAPDASASYRPADAS
ncbi:DUF4255 domain-containing protein [Massilia sp. CFBP9012]|uniref:DUF4255 domain-containing protein n=1 Tax=Massilia sp. CFBP9012 TaxID=3096531 RepID=UPI002A69F6EC|nr:DUF4255 domain-containing protein [Massilia sp. CFBP9012]MDY0973396.1 DUF4255 domain-containing protein [Massilia sp. CFBP9012]